MVVATQNPVEMEGTYPLPEAQRDRFMARVSIGYPSAEAELQMLDIHGGATPLDDLQPVAHAHEIVKLIDAVRTVHVADAVRRYAVELVAATRTHPDLRLGASPRATLHLLRAAKASAALSGREYALPDDVQALAVAVLAHRLLPTAQAQLNRRTAEQVVAGDPAAHPRARRAPAADRLHGGPRADRLRPAAAPEAVMTHGGTGYAAEEDKGGLRTALAGLTTRGRSFLAAGIAAAICAYVLGQSDLLRVGLLLAVLPLVCATVLYRTRYRVAGSRRLSPARVPAGSEARVHLRMDNVSRLPTGLLMLQDRVPYVLGPRPRFVLDRVEAGGRREVSYRVRSDLRGRYPLGPLQLRLTDPFGMCELTRSFSTYDTLTVIPRVEALPPVRLTGEAKGYGDGRQRSLALAGEDDMIPRGYRYGDDLRRVHWRLTARYGELMVRREEQPQRSRCTVLLDTRGIAYDGAGPDSAFEWAVSGTASTLVHMLERGFSVRLLTDTGTSVPGEGADGFAGASQESADAAGLMMDTLAVDRPLGRHGPVPGVRRAARRERRAADRLPRRPGRGTGDGARQDAPAQRRGRRLPAGQ